MPKKQTETELVAARLPSALLKRIDRWSKKAGRMSRSDAIRALIDAGLDSKEGPPAPPWLPTLEALAARLNTDVTGAIEVLREYVEEPAAEPDKPKRRGTKLFGLL
jgi:hypothetical protein